MASGLQVISEGRPLSDFFGRHFWRFFPMDLNVVAFFSGPFFNLDLFFLPDDTPKSDQRDLFVFI